MKRLVEQGVPKKRVAEQFGVARGSIYNWLAADKAEVKVNPPRPSKLDEFKPFVVSQLEEFDLPATVVFEKLKKRGYQGGLTILKEFVRTVKGQQVRRLTERFETEPGRQAQLDWGECGIITDVDGVRRKLYVFTLVLGFSRLMFARFTTSTKQPVLLSLLREAFEWLACPRELLVDNMRQAVDRHARGEAVVFNAAFLDFCHHYDVLPMAAPPYWPRVKGKVERGIKYLKGSFLTGREFSSVADLNEQLEVWLDTVANVRDHGTTGERPIDRYQREASELRPAAAVPRFDTRELLIRTVGVDAHVRFNNVAYSVPPDTRAGSSVQVRVTGKLPGDTLEVMQHGKTLVDHVVPGWGQRRVTLAEHEREIRRLTGARPSKPKERFKQTPADSDQSAFLPATPVVQTRSLSEYEGLS